MDFFSRVKFVHPVDCMDTAILLLDGRSHVVTAPSSVVFFPCPEGSIYQAIYTLRSMSHDNFVP